MRLFRERQPVWVLCDVPRNNRLIVILLDDSGRQVGEARQFYLDRHSSIEQCIASCIPEGFVAVTVILGAETRRLGSFNGPNARPSLADGIAAHLNQEDSCARVVTRVRASLGLDSTVEVRCFDRLRLLAIGASLARANGSLVPVFGETSTSRPLVVGEANRSYASFRAAPDGRGTAGGSKGSTPLYTLRHDDVTITRLLTEAGMPPGQMRDGRFYGSHIVGPFAKYPSALVDQRVHDLIMDAGVAARDPELGPAYMHREPDAGLGVDVTHPSRRADDASVSSVTHKASVACDVCGQGMFLELSDPPPGQFANERRELLHWMAMGRWHFPRDEGYGCDLCRTVELLLIRRFAHETAVIGSAGADVVVFERGLRELAASEAMDELLAASAEPVNATVLRYPGTEEDAMVSAAASLLVG